MNGVSAVMDAGLLNASEAAAATDLLNARLDFYRDTPGMTGHDVLAGVISPAVDRGDCGDSWISGINYLSRAQRFKHPSKSTQKDMQLALLLAANFSMGCPSRLPDAARTYARPNGGEAWPPSESKSDIFVWADGSYMGMALPLRLARAAPDAPGRREWVAQLVTMHLDGYRKYLRDPMDNVYYHAFNYKRKEHSCCKWGRANGWLMMSRVEALLAADEYATPTPNPTSTSNFTFASTGGASTGSDTATVQRQR